MVNIAVLSRSPEQDNPLMRDPFFRRFSACPSVRSPQMSAGSGVIVDAANGYVLTNHHVVKDAAADHGDAEGRAPAPGQDGRQRRRTDIALLQIEADNLKALPFGDSDALRVGDYVLAIGNPFGLGQTVTTGIVSALGPHRAQHRRLRGLHPDRCRRSTPATRAARWSTCKGELIGINTAIIGPTGGNVGRSYRTRSRRT